MRTGIESLKTFIEDAERSELHLSHKEIERLGNDLVEAAKVRAGYEEVVWQAGVYLLLSMGVDESIDDFYQRYGYRVVANALHATFANGDFPRGLGFIVNDFLPGNSLRGLVNHPSIQKALGALRKEQLRVPVDNFLAASPKLRLASVQFLDVARSFGLPPSCCLQISSSLLAASFSSDQEREPALRVFLDVLLSEGRDINLLYCWRAAMEKHPSLANDSTYCSILPKIVRRCRDMNDHGIAILEQLLEDQPLVNNVSNDNELLLLLGLAGWWLYVRQHQQGQGLTVAWQMIWELAKSSPALHKALKSFLENDQPPTRTPEEIEHLQKTFQHIMQRLREELRLRTYRGVALAIQICRHNLIHIFEPLYEALESSSALPNHVVETIQSLDASALVDENPLQKDARFQKIIGELRSNMIKDYKATVQLLQEALQLRLQLSQNSPLDAETIGSLFTDDVHRETTDLCRRYPDLQWAMEWFLPETIATI